MGKLHTFFEDQDGPVTSRTIYPQRVVDESGLFQVAYNGTGSFTVKLEAQASPTAPWYELESLENGAMGANDTEAKVIVIFPNMRCRLALTTGTPEVSAWLVE